ncbi:MAG: TIGR03862 family flavoprotein [Xanthomonadaceae bacterium]|nr:TIGR03862 family flavoprotein [Xanthomonadaceae bacterium]
MKNIAIIGSGPAGLMVADQLSDAGMKVTVYEKRKSAGRKLLIAGSSGLNITYDAPLEELVAQYGAPHEMWDKMIRAFTARQWRNWIEELGIPTFVGTSRRVFVEDMKAANLLKLWQERLVTQGVEFRFGTEWGGIAETKQYDATILALGGGSWEPDEKPLRWVKILKDLGIKFNDFTASNVGYQVAWPAKFLAESEGKPLKTIVLTSSRGSKKGELMVTKYGLEGTPIYFLGEAGEVRIDLKPDSTIEDLVTRLESAKENLSPMRRVQKMLKLSPVADSLIFHMTEPALLKSLTPSEMAERIKSFPLTLTATQPLDEAISSGGGVDWSELDENLRLKKFPKIYCIGEMIDWDVPTGGFLLQGCVSQAAWVAKAILGQ